MIAKGIDVLERIERLEKLRDDAAHILEVTDRVRDRNVYSIDQIIRYTETVSGTMFNPPPLPRVAASHPYPLHTVPENELENPDNQIDLISNVDWFDVIDDEADAHMEETKPIEIPEDLHESEESSESLL